MDKLPDFYKSLNGDNKTAWVNLINDDPTKAITTYHKAFCVNDAKSKGYCDLLQLFRLLGTLEERKAKGEPIVATVSTPDTADQATLEPIHNALIQLGKKIDSKIPSAEEAVAHADQASYTSDKGELDRLKHQIAEFEKKKKRISNNS